ncbi:cytochrome P450 [Streptomyces melanogenes]|uniref:cytochrome P450 n=1 Tax=Streptomyces melanogenes TaxID=67326 RepID=UPI00167DE1EA|nr:cytochrome P450 [Streptomyces melanogenes]GGP86443.1 cytochrome P450 [Streptomyces melanogenes]
MTTTTHSGCPADTPGTIARHAAGDFRTTYAHLRREHPVYHDHDLDLWVVSRHRDIDEVLRDRHRAFTPAHSYDPIQPTDPEAARIYSSVQDVPVAASTDPPAHTRYRDALTAVWPTSAIQLAPWHSHVEQRALHAAQALAARPDRVGELTAHYARPLTARIMSDLIGIAPEDELCVISGSSGMADLLWSFQSAADQQRCAQSVVDLWKLCTRLVAERRGQPQDDLTTRWISYRDDAGVPLTDAEIASTLMEVLTTNAETLALLTTTTLQHLLTGSGYRHLAQHPDQAPAAIEETLRLDPPLIGWLRTTTRPVTLAGTDLPQGARVLLLMHSAAHDETHGVHATHTFDHRRGDTPPTLNFGAGIHYCPGTQYTRLVARHAVAALTRTLPGLTLTSQTPAPRPTNLILRRSTRLHVTW